MPMVIIVISSVFNAKGKNNKLEPVACAGDEWVILLTRGDVIAKKPLKMSCLIGCTKSNNPNMATT